MKYTNTYDVMEDWGIKISEAITNLLASARKNASGKLTNSIDFEIQLDDDGIILNILYAKHGEFVLSGRRRGAKPPPIDPIIKWIREKKIPVTTITGGPTGKVKKLTKFGQEKTLAYAISRGISKNGIPPFNFLIPWEKSIQKGDMQKDIAKALVKDGVTVINKDIIEFNKKII